jgi:hypothetical protein
MVDETQHAPSPARQISRRAWRFCGEAGEILWETLGADHIAASGTAMLSAHATEGHRNGTDVNRVVEMLLPVKGDGAWRIVCQGIGGFGKPIPDNLA